MCMEIENVTHSSREIAQAVLFSVLTHFLLKQQVWVWGISKEVFISIQVYVLAIVFVFL